MKNPALVMSLLAVLALGLASTGESQPIRKTKKNKLAHGHHAHHPAGPAGVPAGVPTKLPDKRSDKTTTRSSGSPFGTEIVLPAHAQREWGFHVAAEVASSSISQNDAHLGYDRLWALTFQPHVMINLAGTSDGFSGYLTDRFTNYSPTGLAELSTIDRPEIGALKDAVTDEDLHVTVGGALKLPVFDAGGSDLFADPLRVWQLGFGGTADWVIPRSTNHLVGSVKITYDNKATFSHLTSNPDTGATVVSDSYIWPMAFSAMVGITHESGPFTIGIGFHTLNQLAPPRITANGGTLRELSPLSLSNAEVFAAYRFRPRTLVNASLGKGLRTANDVLSYALYNYPQNIADTNLAASLTQLF